ncbi:helix-turn-helix domain-containing protein [Bizionia myxarmorum]|uniref:helix-turn-helix domain-containing protein n=1 Tax=Bizionia myxarmorum TaxID=291186 RepID=UPI001B87651E|nr:helix-turn-helix domain-containing protein [Bizionia myxarmorum]
MNTNPDINLAWQFVTETDRIIFLTGKAGTGKTTFLHKLKNESLKRTVVVAPTGVAAINAKGVTIHSFFQLPFGPILPDADVKASQGFNRKFSKTKINIIKSMDLLVIDEISMVRADLLDGIDKTLRRFRNKNKIFGGVQVLMIGDLQQLSPVIKDHEWSLLKKYYANGYFFSSHAYQQCQSITIELKHIYRQENPEFINILNEIRNNRLSKEAELILNQRFQPDFSPNADEGYIQLTTHNNRAELTNQKELDALKTKIQNFEAQLSGKFPEHAYPNKETLALKVGAQVMFIKNDSSQEKRYFNGKIGKVIKLNKDEVVVRCPDDDFNIVTKPEIWDNINYSVNQETKAITEDKIGSFTQIPLRLAWAITIHKSQGLTFEKAIIDAQGAFAHGQTYVALSRCKSLEGLVLKSKITSSQIISDSQVILFNESANENQPDEVELETSQKRFQLGLISEVFDFYSFLYPMNRILDIYYKNRGSIEGKVEAPLIAMKDAVTKLLKVSNSFNNQLKTISNEENLPETSNIIQERFIKAVSYFKKELDSTIVSSFKEFNFTTDNQALEKDISNQSDIIEEHLETKILYFKELTDGFKTRLFLDLRAKAVFLVKEKPKKLKKAIIDGTTNVELFELLRVLRNNIAQENDLVHYQVFTQKALYAICETLPTTKKELLDIVDMGKVRVEKYGTAILEVIQEFCEENDIEFEEVLELSKPEKKKEPKVDTKLQSLNLFKSGKTIAEIANVRELNENTIFGHLVTFISSGKIKVTDLMSASHFKELEKLIPKISYENLSDLKKQLDDKYDYGEIRLVLESLK